MVRLRARGSCSEGKQVVDLNFAVVLMVALGAFAQPAFAIGKCGSGKRVTCVVDGDTFWLKGEKIRVQGYDAPETTTNICGGNRDIQLGRKATDRLT